MHAYEPSLRTYEGSTRVSAGDFRIHRVSGGKIFQIVLEVERLTPPASPGNLRHSSHQDTLTPLLPAPKLPHLFNFLHALSLP